MKLVKNPTILKFLLLFDKIIRERIVIVSLHLHCVWLIDWHTHGWRKVWHVLQLRQWCFACFVVSFTSDHIHIVHRSQKSINGGNSVGHNFWTHTLTWLDFLVLGWTFPYYTKERIGTLFIYLFKIIRTI